MPMMAHAGGDVTCWWWCVCVRVCACNGTCRYAGDDGVVVVCVCVWRVMAHADGGTCRR